MLFVPDNRLREIEAACFQHGRVIRAVRITAPDGNTAPGRGPYCRTRLRAASRTHRHSQSRWRAADPSPVASSRSARVTEYETQPDKRALHFENDAPGMKSRMVVSDRMRESLASFVSPNGYVAFAFCALILENQLTHSLPPMRSRSLQSHTAIIYLMVRIAEPCMHLIVNMYALRLSNKIIAP